MNDQSLPRQPYISVQLVDVLPDAAGHAGFCYALKHAPHQVWQSDGAAWHQVDLSRPKKAAPRLDTDNEYNQGLQAAPVAAPMNPEAARIILELVQQVIATLLYFARAAHDKNAQAPAQVPFASLPQAWQADFSNVALMAVNGLEAEKRQAAERSARGVADRWITAELLSIPYSLRHHIDPLVALLTRSQTPNLVSEILAAYQEALVK